MDRFRNKQPNEAYFIEFDFEDLCGTATVSSATVTAKVVSSGADVTATITTVGSQTITGTSVYVWVKAGTDGTDYIISCKATASDASVYELEGLMLVAELPLVAATAITGPGCIVQPIIEPVSLAELKQHLRIEDAVHDEDEFLTMILLASRRHVENLINRALLTQTWNYCLSGWPCADHIKVPLGNLQSVSSIKWLDTDATSTTLTVTTDYLVETNNEGVGRVVLPYGGIWPIGALYPSNPITIQFVCGWTTAAKVPAEIRAAIKLIATDLWINREGKVLTNLNYNENRIVMGLLSSSRIWDEF